MLNADPAVIIVLCQGKKPTANAIRVIPFIYNEANALRHKWPSSEATTELLEAFKTTTRQVHIGSKSQSRHEGKQQNPA